MKKLKKLKKGKYTTKIKKAETKNGILVIKFKVK